MKRAHLLSSSFFKTCLLVAATASSLAAFADEVSIPMDNAGLPATDLVYVDAHGKSRILNPQEAWRLKKSSGLDLSKLDPDSTGDVWKKAPTQQDDALDEQLPIHDGDTVRYLGVIDSALGRFRFNIQVQSDNGPPRTYTVLLGRELHSMLLRKELLRRLGYQIPAMKYIKRLNVILPDAETRDKTFPAAIEHYAERGANRWIISSKTSADSLQIALQDVAVMEATPLYYNVAFAPPKDFGPDNQIRPFGPRIIRDLGVIYGVANLPEDINLSEWYVGHTENGSLVFDVDDAGNYSVTLDDALWIVRKIAQLTREDFQAAAAQAHVPDFVAKVMTEILVARRNSLVKRFNVNAPILPFDSKISAGSELVNGRLADQDWQKLGYASFFSGPEKDSPLRQIWWYVASQAQSNVTANLLAKANDALPAITNADVINDHEQKLYDEAMQQFAQNGTTQALRFKSWASPVIYGGIDISRDIVIGSYMGTSGDNGASNIVQLADNFGFHVNAGFYIGFDGVPTTPLPLALQGQVMGSASIEVTHLKPVTSLKSAVQEPLKNEIVPWVFYRASHLLKSVADLQDGKNQKPEDIKKAITDDLNELKNFIGDEESLILTESVSANEGLQLSAQIPMSLSPSIGIQPSANQMLLWRIRFYRPKNDPNTLMIFKDKGALDGLQVTFSGSVGEVASFPVIQFTAKDVSGTADTEVYRVNIDPDPEKNKDLYTNSAALVSALRSGSLDSIQKSQKPTVIATRFRDDSGSLQFLQYINRSLKTDGTVTVTAPNGATDTFLSITDGKQSGGSYQSLFTQAVNYAVQRLKNGTTFNFDTKAAPNPGQTYKGYSQTRTASLQARIGDSFSEPFGKIQYRWEGWDISPDKVQALVDDLGKRYGFELYPKDFLQDASMLQLYGIDFTINFYEKGIQKILGMSEKDKDALMAKYTALYNCKPKPAEQYDGTAGPDPKPCAAMRRFEAGYALYHPKSGNWLTKVVSLFQVSNDLAQFGDFFQSYWKKSTNNVLQAEAILEILSDLEQFASFDDLIQLSGGSDPTGQPINMYAQGMITGFRVGSETLSDPIPSNTYGHVDPNQVGGPMDDAQQILGIDDGEFEAQWLRDHL
jgi:hypothetical protein